MCAPITVAKQRSCSAVAAAPANMNLEIGGAYNHEMPSSSCYGVQLAFSREHQVSQALPCAQAIRQHPDTD